MRRRAALIGAGVYSALMVASLVDFYVNEAFIHGDDDVAVDGTGLIIWMAFLVFVLALAVGRWWVAAVPVLAVPLAACLVVAAMIEPTKNAPSDWFFVGLIFAVYGASAALIGVALRKTYEYLVHAGWRRSSGAA